MDTVENAPLERLSPPRAATHRLAACSASAIAEAVPTLRAFSLYVAERWDLSEEAVEAVALIVSELATNALLHSGSEDITLLLSYCGDALKVRVQDRRHWRPPHRSQPDSEAVSGRGLPLIEAYAAAVDVRPTAHGTLVEAFLPASTASALPAAA